jgi:hypothetical protein
VRRFQYTAIDDATRIRALKIYKTHTQASAIDFLNYVVGKFHFELGTFTPTTGTSFNRSSIGTLRIAASFIDTSDRPARI